MRSSLLITSACATLALALGVALRPDSSSLENIAEAQGSSGGGGIQHAVDGDPRPSESAPAAGGGSNEALTQFANGVEISVSNPRLDTGQMKIDVCYDRPDGNNWLVRGARLQYAGATVSDFGASPIEIRDAPIDGRQKIIAFENGDPVERWDAAEASRKGRRCDTFAFGLALAPGHSDYTLTIGSIRMLPNEGAECETYLIRVQAALDTRGSGIVLGCTQGEGRAVVTIVGKPGSMSQEEAEAIAFSSEYFSVDGPWVFTGTVR